MHAALTYTKCHVGTARCPRAGGLRAWTSNTENAAQAQSCKLLHYTCQSMHKPAVGVGSRHYPPLPLPLPSTPHTPNPLANLPHDTNPQRAGGSASSRLQVVAGDVTDPDSLKAALKDAGG